MLHPLVLLLLAPILPLILVAPSAPLANTCSRAWLDRSTNQAAQFAPRENFKMLLAKLTALIVLLANITTKLTPTHQMLAYLAPRAPGLRILV